MGKFCKFCKHGYTIFEKGGCYTECCLNFFGDSVKKDPLDTCEYFEDDEGETDE